MNMNYTILVKLKGLNINKRLNNNRHFMSHHYNK